MDTDAAGATVAGTVSFTPAVVGGRTLTAPEQAGLDALNAGGVTLAADSLAAFGLTLTVGPPATGTQAITVDPTVADIGVRFQANSGATQRVSTGTLTANTSTPTATPPIPGVSIAAGTILPGATASIRSQISPTATQIGPPYDSNQPFNSTSLDVTLDLAQIGAGLDDLSVNIIATTELIFDPIITDPAVNVYDALGVQGNDYVTFATTQTRTIINGDLFTPEGRGDPTLRGPATDAEVNAVDIVNWSVTIQRLGN